ncbi:cyclophilin peptidyl-prolyl cis-trans isomerase Cyp8 [Dispira parvispora]|uniref:Cyclophilin peptidyl-prolyl cis-trans isomerase Cyp8 n=1 Tax=Dispira parvispora TaxID=1520584 RepID=A0A9W8ATT2_9FUNG|nr:cyclophilin peptidyl-prolyl cis-trans isomerase Cyp8 [Dispira parvispora]
MYITHGEWGNEHSEGGLAFGGKRAQQASGSRKQRIPFNMCSLTLQPFQTPVCTPDGVVFDLDNIKAYAQRTPINPVTGDPLRINQLIRLHYHRNSEGQYCCPVSYKVFNDYSHIVAIRPTGNVFSYESVSNFNLKRNQLKDLVDDTPFVKSDIITLQDPKHAREVSLDLVDKVRRSQRSTNRINATGTTALVLADLEKGAGELKKEHDKFKGSTQVSTSKATAATKSSSHAAHFSTGVAAASFTSTSLTPVTHNVAADQDEEQVMLDQVKGKAYVRLQTNLGELNLELFCEQTPRTCYNFIMLVKKGYYRDVPFHRSIKHFMIQGGDPTGTGRGGESYWGSAFPDEIRGKLSHNQRGMLSMANHGKNTNGSQFFITFRPCQHLDGKHTVFGCVVGGSATLDAMEAVPVDSETDRPLETIKILDSQVFVDPYEEYRQRLTRKQKKQQQHGSTKSYPGSDAKSRDHTTTWFGTQVAQPTSTSRRSVKGNGKSGSGSTGPALGVGKYLAAKRKAYQEAQRQGTTDELETSKGTPKTEGTAEIMPTGSAKRQKATGYSFGNFGDW